jgi:hypothetical protein
MSWHSWPVFREYPLAVRVYFDLTNRGHAGAFEAEF